jgi:O-antigen/teichoic acid export membrane protein
VKRASRNVLAITLSDGIRRLIGFLTIALLARRVGTSYFGAINIGFTVLSYGLMLSSGGLTTFGARAIARGESPLIVNRIVSLRLAMSLAAFVIVAVVATVFVQNPVTSLLILLFSLSLFAQAVLVDWYFQGREDMRMIGVGRTASAVLYLAIVVLFVHTPGDVVLVAIAAVAGDMLAAGLLLSAMKRKEPEVRFAVDTGGWKSLFAQAFPIGAGSVLAHYSINLPPIVIGIVLSNADVGLFGAASKLVFFLLMLDRLVGMLLLPLSSRLHANNPALLASTLNTALRWMVVLALPVCIGGSLLAHAIVPLVFGAQFVGASTAFQILIWFFLLTMIMTVLTSALIATGREKTFGRLMSLSAVVYTVSIVIGTLLYGIEGASAAVILSEALTVVVLWIAVRRSVSLVVTPAILKTVLAGAVMAVAVIAAPSVHVLLMVVWGAVVYAAAVFATRAITIADVSALLRRIV